MSAVSPHACARKLLSVVCAGATLAGGLSFAPVAASAQGRLPQPALQAPGEHHLTPVQYRRHGHWRGHGHRRGWGGPAAAGVIGGLALGALAAGAYGAYGAPVYGGYGPRCWIERQRVYDGWGYVVQDVRVCR